MNIEDCPCYSCIVKVTCGVVVEDVKTDSGLFIRDYTYADKCPSFRKYIKPNIVFNDEISEKYEIIKEVFSFKRRTNDRN